MSDGCWPLGKNEADSEPSRIGSGPAWSQYFKQIAKAVVLPRP